MDADLMGVAADAGRYAPGIGLLVAGALLAVGVGTAIAGLQPLVVAVVIGAVIANTVGVPAFMKPGISTHKLALETGIVLLGAAVAVEELVAAGPTVLGLVVLTVGGGLLLSEAVARVVFRLDGTAPSLLAAGASVCGVSAVVAIGRVLDSRGATLTFAAATVLLFDAITLVAFPLAGEWLALTGREFGVWAGLSMFSTGPVAAAGFAHSPTAGQWATVTKLARNALLGGVAVAYSAVYAARSATEPEARRLWASFPKFLLGFLIVVAVVNLGVLSTAAIASIGTIADGLFLVAFVGLGLSIRLRELRAVGIAPVGVVCIHLLVVSAATLIAVKVVL